MTLFFYAAIPEIINIVKSERLPQSTYFRNFALAFQCKNTSPYITTLPRGGGGVLNSMYVHL